MAFKASKKEIIKKVFTPKISPKNNLDKQEIELMLDTIKKSNFKGSDLDLLYKLVIKLQNQYINIK
jgi:hypothetical protein